MKADELDRVLCRNLCGDANECSDVHRQVKAERTLAQQEARAEREVEVKALRRIERLARELMPHINHLGDDGNAICSKLRALLEGK